MSLKMVVVPILAGGAALAMFKLVSLRRAPVPAPAISTRPGVRVPSAPAKARGAEARLTAATGVLPQLERHTPSVLPLAFWDAAAEQLDAEEAPPTPRPTVSRMRATHDTYDSIDPEDLGVEWLSRATESFDVRRADADEDVAEMPADSLSMVSEASRFAAASASFDPPSERLEELGADSRSLDSERAPRSG